MTFTGIMVNNRTNRRAITAADERNHVTIEAAQRNVELANSAAQSREHDKWRRDALLATMSAVLDTYGRIRQKLFHDKNWNFQTEDELHAYFEQAREELRSAMGKLLYQLEILSTHYLAGGTMMLIAQLNQAIDASSVLALAIRNTPEEDRERSISFKNAQVDHRHILKKAKDQQLALTRTMRSELGIPDPEVSPMTPYASHQPAA
ncbi:hypothetical protein KHQ06_08025 [Nocardia tengchongensis]|uniref:Uncharacterized protein n=1 Tax=Nocardia tengchongensis TaxID=2055889 RepID=A0ABX8CVG5_9NOCA|nr:hypothetical protein [Nocardia tengchongensis]QVI22899.1 hypothetical protein KHQ06_08025 [Nocardia tengchongensis]